MNEKLAAIVRILVTAAVNVANVAGYALDADVLLNATMSVLAAASMLWVWWKNANITDAAVAAQAYLDQLKGGSNGN